MSEETSLTLESEMTPGFGDAAAETALDIETTTKAQKAPSYHLGNTRAIAKAHIRSGGGPGSP